MKKIKLNQFINSIAINSYIVIWYEEDKTLYDYELLTKKEWNKLKNLNIVHICINGNAIQITVEKEEKNNE